MLAWSLRMLCAALDLMLTLCKQASLPSEVVHPHTFPSMPPDTAGGVLTRRGLAVLARLSEASRHLSYNSSAVLQSGVREQVILGLALRTSSIMQSCPARALPCLLCAKCMFFLLHQVCHVHQCHTHMCLLSWPERAGLQRLAGQSTHNCNGVRR